MILSDVQPGLRNTASHPYSLEDPFHHIPFLYWKEPCLQVLLSQVLSRNTQDLQQPFKFSFLELLSSQPLAIFILRLLSSHYPLFFPYIHKENLLLISWLWSCLTHHPTSQTLFTHSPILLLHFPFLRLSMSIPFCSPLFYSIFSNPALLELRRWRWIYTWMLSGMLLAVERRLYVFRG